jgi:hypothetical protein
MPHQDRGDTVTVIDSFDAVAAILMGHEVDG